MAFIGDVKKGVAYASGFMVAVGDENITRETKEAPTSLATVNADGTKYIKMGTPFPSNDGNCIGFVYEDTDVTVGNMPCSVITGNATIYLDRLPVTLADAAKTALAAKGFKFVDTAPAVTRPY